MMERRTFLSKRTRSSARSFEALEERKLLDSHLPELVADNIVARQNSEPQIVSVLANDVFPVGYEGAQSITSVSFGTEGGKVTISEDSKSLRYTPPADFSGTESFVYFVDDQAHAEVIVEVEAPLANDKYTIPPDGIERNLNVLRNDPFWEDYSGPKQITLVSQSSAGAHVEIADDGQTINYVPSNEGHGRDQFIYIVDELYSARVEIEVPPTLSSDSYEILQNADAVRLNVLSNDPFWPTYNRAKQITAVSDPHRGTVSISENGKFVLYEPDEDAFGWDSFTYVVDGEFEANATVIVHRPVQDDWTEIDYNSSNQPINVISNDYYYERNRTRRDVVDRVTGVGQSENGGTLSISDDGQSILYTAAEDFSGIDRFTYIADDRYPATVSVNVTRPVRNDGFYRHVFQDTPNAFLPVLENDFLGNGYQGAKQITSVGQTENGGEVSLDRNRLSYTPVEGYTGSDSFTYTVDNELEAQVHLSVLPLAQHDHQSLCVNDLNGPIEIEVLHNDYFNRGYLGEGVITSVTPIDDQTDVSIINGEYLEVELGSAPHQRLEYTVDEKYSASVSLSVTGHTRFDNVVVHQNAAAQTIDVLANDFRRISGRHCLSTNYQRPRRISAVSESANGAQVSVSADGRSVSYIPPADFLGRDTFTYEVDGVMQGSVSVNVIRLVRDDEFRVSPESERSLSVLTNDLFGSTYQDAGKITDVSTSQAGATLQIADDGESIQYAAPLGFSGTDSFEYTVDGRQKATVSVSVRAENESVFPRFESLSDYENFLKEDAKARYQHLFGQIRFRFSDGLFDNGEVAPPADPNRGHSETNVQVEGVDEGDIVEFDADYIYSLSGQELVIMDAWPGEELSVASRTLIDGAPEAEFLKGDRLTVISKITEVITDEDDTDEPTPDNGFFADVRGDIFFPYPSYEINYFTVVTVFDVSDRTNPQVVQKTTMEGNFVESRAIGDFVYLAVNNSAVAPSPEVVTDIDENGNEFERYETEDEYFTRLQAGALIDAALPNYSSAGPDGMMARTGLLNEPEEIYLPLTKDATNLLSIVSVNVMNSEPGLASTAAVYTTGGSIVYASLDNFYVFETDYVNPHQADSIVDDTLITRIHKFDWNSQEGSVQFVAAGSVPGQMINQFSADEHDGHLRIATTTNNAGTGNWSYRDENTLFVLNDNGGSFEYVGALHNLALDETLRSIRFMGDRAFAVTFRNVDPLFGLDLSDPQNPDSVGSVTLPGFSTYMQFISNDRLLAVGKNTPNGVSGPAQVSLFDVSQLNAPRMIDQYTFERFSTTEAGIDHHAFGYFAEHDILALPSTRGYRERVDEDGDGFRETSRWIEEHELYVFRIDETAEGRDDSAIELLSSIEHESAVRRSGYIGDKLYSIANDSAKAVSVADPATVIGVVEDLTQVEVEQPPVIWPIWGIEDADGFAVAAAEDLADRLQIDVNQILNVATEPADSENALEVVLRVGETQYLYTSNGEDEELVDGNYQFVDSSLWTNPNNPLDVNGDGEISPNDAIQIANKLDVDGPTELSSQSVVRQVQDQPESYWDTNGDGLISPSDALLIINFLNENTGIVTNPSPVDPATQDTELVDSLFGQIRGTIGDSNLDGRFDSADLVAIFQAGKFEDEQDKNASWSEGDWDGDRDFTTRDLVLAFQFGRYNVG